MEALQGVREGGQKKVWGTEVMLVKLIIEKAMQEAGLSVVDFVNVRMVLWRCWKGSGTAGEARGCRVLS